MATLHRHLGFTGLIGLSAILWVGQPAGAATAEVDGRPDLRKVQVKSVWKSSEDPRVISLHNVVFLRDLKTQRLLPVWIGHFEADAIRSKLRGELTPRPMTQDLFRSLLEAAGAQVRYVLVDALRPTGTRDTGTYFAKISLGLKGGGSAEVDSRTSDAIALSLRTGAPIYVAGGIMEANSIADEGEIEAELKGEEGKGSRRPGRPEIKDRKPGTGYY